MFTTKFTLGAVALANLISGSPLRARTDVSSEVQWVNCLDNIPVPIQQANVTLREKLPGTLKCGYLTVPLDYSKPLCQENSLNISFAANLVNSRNGLLMYNPGGPGEEARSYAWALAGIPFDQYAQVAGLENFDFVAVDTRGTWSSNPFNCTQANFSLPLSIFDNAADYEAYGENIQNLVDDCARNTLPAGILDHVGSDAVAEDFESLRKALGYEKMNYLGYSYGSLYGQTYLSKHSDKAGRFVLDGVASYSQPTADLVGSQGEDFNRLLERADAWCQYNSSACLLGSLGNGSVINTWQTVLEQYSNPSTSNSSISSNDIIGLTSIAFFAGNPKFLSFTSALALAASGNASFFEYTPEFAAYYTQALITGGAPTLCSDLRIEDKSFEGYSTLMKQVKDGDKYGGSFGAFYSLAAICAFWPSSGTSDLPWLYNNVTDIEYLLVTSDYDFNTPTEGTDIVKRYSPNSTMIARHGDDHGSIFVPGPVRNLILDYLYNGTIPLSNKGEIYDVYGPGEIRLERDIVDPYKAPLGAVAGDVE